MTSNLLDDGWVPDACTLPTTDQPLRLAEFDDLFATDVLDVVQVSSENVRLRLRPGPAVAARAADLAARETGCCSFFTFRITIAEGELTMDVSVAEAHLAVLAAFAARAASAAGARA